ncbi:MAG: hypothetical protein AB7K24_33190 [Gemmataceae bacterium]
MNEHCENFEELEQLLRELPARQPSAQLEQRIERVCRPRAGSRRLLVAFALAASVLIGVVALWPGHTPNVPVQPQPQPIHPEPVLAREQPSSVRPASMIGVAAGSFLPTLTLLHCPADQPAPGGKS